MLTWGKLARLHMTNVFSYFFFHLLCGDRFTPVHWFLFSMKSLRASHRPILSYLRAVPLNAQNKMRAHFLISEKLEKNKRLPDRQESCHSEPRPGHNLGENYSFKALFSIVHGHSNIRPMKNVTLDRYTTAQKNISVLNLKPLSDPFKKKHSVRFNQPPQLH